jgi:hypothetical protein
MATLVFQVFIKQWDKGQRLDVDIAARDKLACGYQVLAEPEFLIFGHPCIIDQHSINFASDQSSKYINRPLKKSMLADGAIKLERFIISESISGSIPESVDKQSLSLEYQAENQEVVKVANFSLDKGWIQVKYNWRYRVETENKIFWQYEELVLNVALVSQLDNKYFLTTDANAVYNFEASI